ALVDRERTGCGQLIDFSQVEAMVTTLGEAIAHHQLAGADPAARNMRHPTLAPHGHYPCAGEDRWIALAAATDGEWVRMTEALDAPRRAADDRFRAAAARHVHAEELDAAIAAVTASRDRDALFERLRSAGVTAAPVLDLPGARANEHVRDRGVFETLEH